MNNIIITSNRRYNKGGRKGVKIHCFKGGRESRFTALREEGSQDSLL